ncbi:MAG: carbon-nitrogen hydrolase family protein [Oceanospirillaceae bacterium]|nr:carbon-nitrogen hydrolase family protein [Oceanospirillaceae bacterium]
MSSSNNRAQNIDSVVAMAASAAAQNCDLLALPEAAGMMNANLHNPEQQLLNVQQDPFIQTCKELAQRHNLWLHTGSTAVLGSAGKLLNHSDLVDDQGVVRCSYDKIHLFDVQLQGQKSIVESDRYAHGSKAVLVDTPWGAWGQSICYDLRFPQLYRRYAQAGASVVFVPSAFTMKTGRDHWETLLRARAIENGLWIIAAAQVGTHDNGRQSWGHSLVISPWGEVCCDLGGSEVGIQIVELDIAQVADARAQIPSLVNEQTYILERC